MPAGYIHHITLLLNIALQKIPHLICGVLLHIGVDVGAEELTRPVDEEGSPQVRENTEGRECSKRNITTMFSAGRGVEREADGGVAEDFGQRFYIHAVL